jgi:hypothetical protein
MELGRGSMLSSRTTMIFICRLSKLLRVHFAESLVSQNGQVFFAVFSGEGLRWS